MLHKVSCKSYFDEVIDGTLFFVVLALVLFIGIGCFYITYPEGDVMEHIYDTYLVSVGYVPYRDFFEHHHPLLWYMLAPFIGLLHRNIEVIGWADYVTFCFFVWGLWFVYRIVTDFLSTRTAALLALIYVLLPDIFLYYVYYKPDNWMLTCIAGGCYFYFKYLKEMRRGDLVYSYAFFFVAFLFIQKAIFYYPVIGVASLWALYKKDMKVKDFLIALVFPLICTIGGLVYFYVMGCLKEYFFLNFIFNREMTKLFEGHQVSYPFYMGWVIMGFGLVVSLALYKSENKYFRFYCWLFWLLLMQKIFYFSPFVYYWYEAYYFGVPLAAVGVVQLAHKQKLLLYAVFIETLVYASFMGYYVYHDIVWKTKHQLPSLQEYMIIKTNACDSYIGFGSGALSLFNYNPLYYWFLQGHVDIFGNKMGLHEIEDINQAILDYKPKIIWLEDVAVRYNEQEVKKPKILHKPNIELIEEYYEPTDFATNEGGFNFKKHQFEVFSYKHGFWRLKPQYWKKNCVFDESSGRWTYDED